MTNLDQYGAYILHLRQLSRIDSSGMAPRRNQLCFLLGSGVSIGAGVPNWPKLVDAIASGVNQLGINGLPTETLGSHAYFTQLLYEGFRSHHHTNGTEQIDIDTKWKSLVREKLYENILDGTSFEDGSERLRKSISNHPYISNLAFLTRRAPITITYNFDSLLEEAIHLQLENEDPGRSVRPDVIWSPKNQLRGDDPIIYHVNGYLPFNIAEKWSQSLVLSEAAFADVLAQLSTAQAGFVSNYLNRQTFLILGTSLEDASLKNLLRMNAHTNPAHHHYYIHYMEDNDSLTNEAKEVIWRTNFDIYNLHTMFLCEAEIAELLDLLSKEDSTFDEWLTERNIMPTKRVYYIVGAVGSGKSTLVENLRSYHTHEEWPERRNSLIYKNYDSLVDAERADVDKWILSNIKRKNDVLHNSGKGIHVMDRAPLDALSFTPGEDEDLETYKRNLQEKAANIDKVVCEGGAIQLHDGTVILLEASAETLANRVRSRGKKDAGGEDYLKKQQERLKRTYPNALVVNNENGNMRDALKRIVEIISSPGHDQENLSGRLVSFKEGEVI